MLMLAFHPGNSTMQSAAAADGVYQPKLLFLELLKRRLQHSLYCSTEAGWPIWVGLTCVSATQLSASLRKN